MNNTQRNTANPQTKSQICLQFERVGLRYGRGDEVLKDISFSLQQGSLNFVTGPSGAGKTSLLKLMYLHMRPSRGLITLFGQDISALKNTDIPALKQRMGIVLQGFHLIEHLSVFENTALPLRITGQNRDAYIKDVTSLLQWVGLGEKLHALPATLSGGEKQRAAIARAIIGKPDILIADEPTGSVDHAIAKRLMHLFVELNRLGTTIIIATHDKSLIPEDANILQLSAGNITYKKAHHGA